MGRQHNYGVDDDKEGISGKQIVKGIKYLFSDWLSVGKILQGRFIYLFLDYDGTLAPIVEAPEKAVVPEGTKDLLRQLSKMPNCKIAIVSGRSLRDISGRIGLKNVVYVGNHGFEIRGPKIRFKSPVPVRYRKTLDEIKDKLEKSLLPIKGLTIEDKGFSLSVHYRLVKKKDIAAVKEAFFAVISMYERRKSVQVRAGKMVLEIRPPIPWGKGKVVLWLLGRQFFMARNNKMKILPIYAGDDTTDEDAFESLRGKGLTIRIGKPERTKARFYLRDTEETARFLKLTLKILSSGNHE